MKNDDAVTIGFTHTTYWKWEGTVQGLLDIGLTRQQVEEVVVDEVDESLIDNVNHRTRLLISSKPDPQRYTGRTEEWEITQVDTTAMRDEDEDEEEEEETAPATKARSRFPNRTVPAPAQDTDKGDSASYFRDLINTDRPRFRPNDH